MMLGMGLYLLLTHTPVVYEQTRFFSEGRGGGDISTQPNPIRSIFSSSQLARNKFSLDISLKRCWISFHCAWGWI